MLWELVLSLSMGIQGIWQRWPQCDLKVYRVLLWLMLLFLNIHCVTWLDWASMGKGDSLSASVSSTTFTTNVSSDTHCFTNCSHRNDICRFDLNFNWKKFFLKKQNNEKFFFYKFGNVTEDSAKVDPHVGFGSGGVRTRVHTGERSM